MSTVIVSFSFGKPPTLSGNVLTAKWAVALSRGIMPIVADRSVPVKARGLFFIGSEEAKDHVSTLKLVKQFYQLAVKCHWSKVVVACASDYLPRVVRDIKKVFEKNNYIAEIIEINLSAKEDINLWYDRKSTQIWTRYRRIFKIYEFILIKTPFWLYEWITG